MPLRAPLRMKMPRSWRATARSFMGDTDLRGMAVPAMPEFIWSPRAGRPCHESLFSGETRRTRRFTERRISVFSVSLRGGGAE